MSIYSTGGQNSDFFTMSDPLPTPEPPPAETAIRPGFPTQPVPPVTETLAYQPISGYAIAGIGVAGLLFLLVVILTIVALTQSAPLFVPAWMLALMAVAGVVLCLLAQNHIQNSEGTRAGAKLARIGLWLSIISGLSYFSYYFVTGFALESQANAFLMEKSDNDSGFFPRLRDGATDPLQLNTAFLLTQPANRRSVAADNENELMAVYDKANMQDGAPGALSQFKYGYSPMLNGALPRIFFGKAAKEAEITPLSVQDWKYEMKSYKVRRNYLIKTPELEWEVTLAVASTEGEGGQGRKWFVNLGESSPVNKRLTKFGEGIYILRVKAKETLEQQIAKLNSGQQFARIADLDKTEWDKKGVSESQKEAAMDTRAAIHKMFTSAEPRRIEGFMIFHRPEDVGRWEETGGKYRFYHGFRFVLPKDLLSKQPAVTDQQVDGYAVLETVEAVTIEDGRPARMPNWELIKIVFTSVGPVAKGGPGGMGQG